MAGRKANLPTLNYFDNPNEDHVAMSAELRPTFILSAEELQVWDRITPWLAMQNRLKPWYMDTLIEYCRVVNNINATVQYFRQEGNNEFYTVSTRNGSQKKVDPRISQLNEQRRILRSYVGDFGLTPAAEKALNVMQDDIFGDNPFAQFKAANN